jgi:hypothetical protein
MSKIVLFLTPEEKPTGRSPGDDDSEENHKNSFPLAIEKFG